MIENKNPLEITIYPNPTTESFKISIDPTLQYEVSIMDISGKVLFSKIYQGSIDVSHFSPGIYVVSIQCAGKTAIKKLIIQ